MRPLRFQFVITTAKGDLRLDVSQRLLDCVLDEVWPFTLDEPLPIRMACERLSAMRPITLGRKRKHSTLRILSWLHQHEAKHPTATVTWITTAHRPPYDLEARHRKPAMQAALDAKALEQWRQQTSPTYSQAQITEGKAVIDDIRQQGLLFYRPKV